MTLRLVPRDADPLRFAEHAVSRLRFDPSRRAVAGASARRRPLLSDAPFVEDPRGEAHFLDEPGFNVPGPGRGPADDPRHGSEHGQGEAPDHRPDRSGDRSADHSSDPAPDYAVARAQAEAEDIALVRLAAAKLAVALREVSVLLRRERGTQRSDALARCTAKGWITLQGDPWAASQTFRVTSEGYQAAGLRPPPFAV